MKSHKNLIVDLNNNIFVTRFAKIRTPKGRQRKEAFAREMIFKETVSYIVRTAMAHKCDGIVVTVDSPTRSWRKELYPEYKQSEQELDIYYDDCINAANLTKEFFKTCTNAMVLEVKGAEADDIIGVFAQECGDDVENEILSSDKDFIQLINDQTSLYSPPQKKYRTSEDPEYDLFVKCIRGDKNDNLPSAYPRVRETVLQKAWEDSYEMQNLMETVRKDGVKVGDAYEFNKSMIDLTLQPTDLRDEIIEAIKKPYKPSFGEFKIMKFFVNNYLKEHKSMLERTLLPLKKMPYFGNK